MVIRGERFPSAKGAEALQSFFSPRSAWHEDTEAGILALAKNNAEKKSRR